MKKINKFLGAIFAIVMMLGVSLSTLAHDFEVDGIYYNILDETAKTVQVSFSGSSYSEVASEYSGEVTIPSSVSYNDATYSVTTIGESAFRGCSGLTSVTIPNSVNSIGEEAFYRCSGLTGVNITDLSAWCKIDFNKSNSNPLRYAQHLKLNGTEITNLIIPNDITKIKDYTFYDCDGLISVTISNSVTYIGESAFYDCDGLISVTIPNTVTSIEYEAFYGCDGLTEVNITDLSAWCKIDFNENTSNPLSCANHLKLNGTEIANLVIPDDITEIKKYAFWGCSGLASVTMPNSVTSIGSYAFNNCFGLTSVTIPNSVTSISEYAFYGCSNLTSVVIPNKVTSIEDGTFKNCYSMTSVSIPNSVTSIGYQAFYRCSNLTSVTIPNSVTYIGESAFYDCDGLTSVIIPNSVTSIGDWAFYGCGLALVTIGNSVSSIGHGAFNGCTELSSVTIPNSVTYIGDEAFSYCSGLTSVTIPDSVTYIGDWAFSGCSGLTSVTIPNSVTSIGNYTFYCCSGLTSVTIPNSATSIGSSAFSGCSGLTSVTIPNAVTFIGNEAFRNCSSLTSVTIGNSVTSIGDEVFKYCFKLNKIISLNPTPPLCESEATFYIDNYTKATLYVPNDSYTKYFKDGVWGKFTNIVKIETLVSSIKLNATSIQLDKGAIYTLSATINPTDATITDILWTSSNPQVATVDRSGKVIALSTGTTTISATIIDGSDVSASCVVTVGNAGITDVKSDNTATEVARYDINGRMLAQPTKGINIIKMSDGSIRKEWVKE